MSLSYTMRFGNEFELCNEFYIRSWGSRMSLSYTMSLSYAMSLNHMMSLSYTMGSYKGFELQSVLVSLNFTMIFI